VTEIIVTVRLPELDGAVRLPLRGELTEPASRSAMSRRARWRLPALAADVAPAPAHAAASRAHDR
jgi:hypothetical protein